MREQKPQDPPTLRLLKGRGNGTDSGGRKIPPGPAYRREPIGPPPEGLGEVGRAEWEHVAAEMDRLELAKPMDRQALASYCLAVERQWAAQEIVRDEGVITVGQRGVVKNPAVTVVEEAGRMIRAWAREFGMTPSAENNLAGFGQREEAGDDGNPFAGGVAGGQG